MSGVRPTVVVLGSFLEREYCELWQRQQEFTGALCRRANVLFVERAAAGRITARRVVGRLRKLARPGRPVQPMGDVPLPEFVHWRQVPSNSPSALRRSAARVAAAVDAAVSARGWAAPSFVCMGTPGEVWAGYLQMTGLPFWYDIWERLTASPAYRDVPEATLAWLAREATLVTADTRVSQADWAGIRPDVLLVPHGAKEWAEAPDFSVVRDALYYVGSPNPANLDVSLLSAIGARAPLPVRMIGSDPNGTVASVQVLGWRPSGAIPRVMSDAVAGLVPYWENEFTAGTYPTKVYDYLLAGAPVLATALPALEGMPGVITCRDVDDFVAAADEARRMPDPMRRDLRAWALENGWSKRFETVRAALRTRDAAPEVWE